MSELTPPPNNEEAEISVLGSVLIEGKLIGLVNDKLKPDDFYKDAHKIIVNTMVSMYKENIPIDLVTLSDRLDKEGHLKKVGDNIRLTYLMDMTPNTANINYYIKLVKEASDLRKIHNITTKLNQRICNKEIDAIRAKSELENFITNLDITCNSDEVIQLSKEPPPKPREWIWEGLIPKGFPTTFYASGGVGKSYIAMSLGLYIARGCTEFIGKSLYPNPLNTLYLDYELGKDEIMRRAIELSNGMGLESIPDNFYYNIPGLTIKKSLDSLRSIIRKYNIELLIIDSMGASGLDAMDEKSVILIYNKLHKLGVTSILIDHQSKIQSQDNPDNKSPFGSVYKSNMSRSVIHLIQQSSANNCSTIILKHNKSNFGAKSDELLLDIRFGDGYVAVEKSNSMSKKDEQLFMIRDYMIEGKENGHEINQSEVIDSFEGIMGKHKVASLLKMGEGKYWNSSRGKNNSSIYNPIDNMQM